MKTSKWYFLLTGALILAVALLVGSTALGGRSAVAAPSAAGLTAIPGPAMPPYPEAPSTLNGTVRTFHLWAKAGTLTMPDAATVDVWGFATDVAGAAVVPGPILRANEGETLEIYLHNDLAGETVALSFPGQEGVRPDVLGAASGAATIYTFTPPQPGTFLYEAGLTSNGARQVAMGLAGPLIIQETVPPYTYTQEVVLVLNAIDPAFHANPTTFDLTNFRPKYWLFNGLAYPNTGWIGVAPGATVRMRYLNAGTAQHSIGLLGLQQMMVAANGHSETHSIGAITKDMGPGQTFEGLVTIPLTAEDGMVYPIYNASLHQHNNNQRLAGGPPAPVAFGGMLTFLQVQAGLPAANAGPVASNVTVQDPVTLSSRTTGVNGVTLSATFTDADGVTLWEYYTDALGGPAGAVQAPAGGGSPATVNATIDAATLAGWASGYHTLYVRAQDALGNWGLVGSAVLNLDKTGPAIWGLGIVPSSTNGTAAVLLTGTADDTANGNGQVISAEYAIDGGAWQPMALNGTPIPAISATIPQLDVAALAEGIHPVSIRAQDDLGNIGALGLIDLVVDKTGPSTTAVSLSATQYNLNDPLAIATVKFRATIVDDLGAAQSPLANAEAFIGTVGANGTGIPLFPADGLFDELTEDAYYDYPAVNFRTLAPGIYNIYVHGLDSAGNWGPVNSTTIEIVAITTDTLGPIVTNMRVNFNPTGNRPAITLLATATDPGMMSNVTRVNWFWGTNPNTQQSWTTPVDGAFDEPQEDVRAGINLRNMTPGVYNLSMRARDALGNWGPVETLVLIVGNP